MTSGLLSRFAAVVFALLALQPALAAQEAPDALVRRLSGEVLNDLRADPALKSGNIEHIIALVDKSVMPNVNFRRMTAAAVGPAWRRATPEQQARLQEGFKTLLIRTYSGALAQVGEQTVVVKPLRAASASSVAGQSAR